MFLKQIVVEDFVNYKTPSLFLGFPKCSFKCDKENKVNCCQNSALAKQDDIEIGVKKLIGKYYINNPITKSIVCGGLEPFDSFNELYNFIAVLRHDYSCNDTVVIYTGYNYNEIKTQVKMLTEWKNIIIKYGRYIPNQEPKYDEVLGVILASPNQYAVEES